MPAPTLVSMAQRACIHNIAGLQDVGDISYELLRPILKKIQNPQQLKELEDSSSHIADHDAELWKAFIARDVMDWQQKLIEPKNPRSWGKVYRKLVKEEERAKEAQEEQLRATMAGIKKQREENHVAYVEKIIAEPKRQTAFIDGKPNPNVRCLGTWVMEKKPALKNAKTGSQIISAIRRETSNEAKKRAKELRAAAQPHQPVGAVPSARRQIPRAPQGMVSNYARSPPPAVVRKSFAGVTKTEGSTPSPRVFVSRHAPTPRDKAISEAARAEQAKKEDRLRALAHGPPKTTAQSPPVSLAKDNNITSAPTSAPTSVSARGSSKSTTQNSPATPAEDSTAKSAPTPVPSDRLSTPTRDPVAEAFEERRSALKAVADSTRRLSPSPAPAMRRRPATPVSVFMPAKKKKV